MDKAHFSVVRRSLDEKATTELLQIWTTNDRQEWSAEAFEAIGQLLAERGEALPKQTEREEIMNADRLTPNSSNNTKDSQTTPTQPAPPPMKASSIGIRFTFFFVGAMLVAASWEAVGIFALGQHEWTPWFTFLVAIPVTVVLMGIAAALFAVSTLRTARNNYVSVAWCAVLGAAYAMGLPVLDQMLPRILDSSGWPSFFCSWVYLLGAPPSLGLLIARRRNSEKAPGA